MTFVAQYNNDQGCALAAIASVTDLTYQEALEKLSRKNFNPNNGLYLSDIRKCLIKLGKKVPPSVYLTKSKRNETWIVNFLYNQKYSAILCIDNLDEIPDTFHCVVWESKYKSFWDPFNYGYREFYDFDRAYRIITIK